QKPTCKIAPHHCVWVMNLEVITQKLYEFCNQMINDGEKGAEESKQQFTDLFSQIKIVQNQIIFYIACLFNQTSTLEIALNSIFGNPPDNLNKVSNHDLIQRLEPLFEYVNICIKVICENMDFKVCIKVLEKIYSFIINNLE